MLFLVNRPLQTSLLDSLGGVALYIVTLSVTASGYCALHVTIYYRPFPFPVRQSNMSQSASHGNVLPWRRPLQSCTDLSFEAGAQEAVLCGRHPALCV